MIDIKGTSLRVKRADTYLKRLKGLMFDHDIDEGLGLMIVPCQSIHTFFMRFDLDVVVVDRNDRVIACYKGLKPGKITPILKNAYGFIEFKAGTFANHQFQIGETLTFEVIKK